MRDRIIDAVVWLFHRILHFVYPYKHRGLARRLHDIADQYDPRPTGKWEE